MCALICVSPSNALACCSLRNVYKVGNNIGNHVCKQFWRQNLRSRGKLAWSLYLSLWASPETPYLANMAPVVSDACWITSDRARRACCSCAAAAAAATAAAAAARCGSA